MAALHAEIDVASNAPAPFVVESGQRETETQIGICPVEDGIIPPYTVQCYVSKEGNTELISITESAGTPLISVSPEGEEIIHIISSCSKILRGLSQHDIVVLPDSLANYIQEQSSNVRFEVFLFNYIPDAEKLLLSPEYTCDTSVTGLPTSFPWHRDLFIGRLLHNFTTPKFYAGLSLLCHPAGSDKPFYQVIGIENILDRQDVENLEHRELYLGSANMMPGRITLDGPPTKLYTDYIIMAHFDGLIVDSFYGSMVYVTADETSRRKLHILGTVVGHTDFTSEGPFKTKLHGDIRQMVYIRPLYPVLTWLHAKGFISKMETPYEYLMNAHKRVAERNSGERFPRRLLRWMQNCVRYIVNAVIWDSIQPYGAQ